MSKNLIKTAAVIIAHPDDETLWAGGTILRYPSWRWFIVSLCRGSDQDRAPKFYNVLKALKADGIMGDLDDGPEQTPLDENEVKQLILNLLPFRSFDLVVTHNPNGEYTRHLRHEETSKAVIQLWQDQKISTDELWTFAYEDGAKKYSPKPIRNAAIYTELTQQIWLKKYNLITGAYGFPKSSFEAQTTPRAEAFWRFTHSNDAMIWLNNGGILI